MLSFLARTQVFCVHRGSHKHTLTLSPPSVYSILPPVAVFCLQSLQHKLHTDVTLLTSCVSPLYTEKNPFFFHHNQVDFKHHMRPASPPSSFQILQQTQSSTFSLHNEALCLFGGDAVFEKFCEASLFLSIPALPPFLPLPTVSRFKMS